MKTIDANELKDAIKYDFDDTYICMADLFRCIDRQTIIDAVPVVRCKDCKYSSLVRSVGKYECKRVNGPLRSEDDFCSYGENMMEE